MLFEQEAIRRFLGRGGPPLGKSAIDLQQVLRRGRDNRKAQLNSLIGLELEHARAEVSEWLADARYDGALSTLEERWWGRPVRTKLAKAAGGTRPLDASARVSALAQQLGVELHHEGCSWCRGERTLQACHRCMKATDAAHSVRPLSRPLPAWADSWVVCYSCIADGSADDVTFPQSAHDVVQALTEGRIQPLGE